MKPVQFKLGLQLAIVSLFFFIAIPTLTLNIFDVKFDFPAFESEKLCVHFDENSEDAKTICLPKFKLKNTRDFSNQKVYRFEFSFLNSDDDEIMNKAEIALDDEISEEYEFDDTGSEISEDFNDTGSEMVVEDGIEEEDVEEFKLSPDEKRAIFDKNFEIFAERLKYYGLMDYELKKLETDDGKYFMELDINSTTSENAMFALSTLSTAGEVEIFEDDPNYTKPEEGAEDAPFTFTEGKRKSNILNVNDIKSISYYFNSNIYQGKGGFVVKADFGLENTDKVMQAASYSENSQNDFIGIQLVQNGFPIGVQAEYIQPKQAGYNGQSYILFTSFSNPQDQTQIRALTSILKTKAIDTDIRLVQQLEKDPIFYPQEIQYTKILLSLSVLIVSVLLFLQKRKESVKYISIMIVSLIVSIGLANMLNVNLNTEFILSFILSLLFGLLFFSRVDMFKESSFKLRKSYFIRFLVSVILFFVISALFVTDGYILSSAYALTVFLIGFTYTFEFFINNIISARKK